MAGQWGGAAQLVAASAARVSPGAQGSAVAVSARRVGRSGRAGAESAGVVSCACAKANGTPFDPGRLQEARAPQSSARARRIFQSNRPGNDQGAQRVRIACTAQMAFTRSPAV